jgi:ATP-dependent RNA helicase DeaD
MPFPDTHPSLLRALAARNYTEPTPVQQAVLRPEAADRDLLVSAQTGSGKTVAYGLALGSMLLGDTARFSKPQQPLALIVAPTRELALQVQRELEWLFADTGARVVSCVGGMDIRREQRMLAQGAHIVVGTPGRLSDHLDQRRLDLSQIRSVVLDEADEMLDLGFREELEMLLNATPFDRRTLLFSATLPKSILGLAKHYQRDALRLALSTENEPHGDIEYRAFPIRARDSEHAVVNSLRYFDARGALVFCSTREAVRHLHANLQERGFSAVALSGELKQHERTNALQALRDGRARVCVATDVAARGLDMPDLGLVIHADLPQNRQALLHRSGRTGRAGRKGLSIMLVPAPRRQAAERLLAGAKIKATWSPAPSAEAIRARDEAALVREIAAMAETPAEEDLAAGRVLLAERSPEELAAVLVRLRRELLPAPEVLDDAGSFTREVRPKRDRHRARRGRSERDHKHYKKRSR